MHRVRIAGYQRVPPVEVAAFGDATWYITPKFDVTIGARYSQQNQKYSSNIWWVGFGPPYGQIYP